MRHAKHSAQLGVKKEHRKALVTNLAASLIQHGRIETTLAKAKALRPFVEKVITLAKKAEAVSEAPRKLHYRRLAYSRMRNCKDAVNLLFEEKVAEFVNREGGYTRIYKLAPRLGDGAEMALIELIDGSDEGYKKRKPKGKKKQAKKEKGAKKEEASKSEEDEPKAVVEETEAAAEVKEETPVAEEAPAEKAPAEEAPAEKAPAEKAPAKKAPAKKAKSDKEKKD